jgi:predicted nucleic acid-binding protein
MNRLIFLDSGPLGLVSMPAPQRLADECRDWIVRVLSGGDEIVLPEIADYEVRRELLRAGKTRGLRLLNSLKLQFIYMPITTQVMQRAAILWAQSRQIGKPTSSAEALDGDVILSAQALIAKEKSGYEVLIATTNTRHLSRFVAADLWSNIQPS